jgi:hypothetical protein
LRTRTGQPADHTDYRPTPCKSSGLARPQGLWDQMTIRHSRQSDQSKSRLLALELVHWKLVQTLGAMALQSEKRVRSRAHSLAVLYTRQGWPRNLWCGHPVCTNRFCGSSHTAIDSHYCTE